MRQLKGWFDRLEGTQAHFVKKDGNPWKHPVDVSGEVMSKAQTAPQGWYDLGLSDDGRIISFEMFKETPRPGSYQASSNGSSQSYQGSSTAHSGASQGHSKDLQIMVSVIAKSDWILSRLSNDKLPRPSLVVGYAQALLDVINGKEQAEVPGEEDIPF